MGRRRRHDLDLPPLMYRKRDRYYYGKAGLALGADLRGALRKYAELHTGESAPGSFPDAVDLYRRDVLHTKAPKTQAEYDRQLETLVSVFRDFRVDEIEPADVFDFWTERSQHRLNAKGKPIGGPIVATREKALLSAVINFARSRRLSSKPNPCAGIHGVKSSRDRMVTDAELRTAIGKADPIIAGFLELCYLTGQRPGDVVRMTRADLQDGALCVRQAKTGAKVRIAIVGPLAELLKRLTAREIASRYLVRDERGQPFTLSALRRRFKKLGYDWQIRDLRAKAASDSRSSKDAQTLLGHAAATTTDGYIRQRAGAKAKPVMRKISDRSA
jgi:integrase